MAHSQWFPRGLVVCGDDGKLRQVLINLLGNAVKFTETGNVTFRVTEDSIAENLDERTEREAGFSFEIIDTGPGIPAERQDEIFEAFHQDEAGMKMGGTGLGLAISRRHVEMMGGSIKIESPYPVRSTIQIDDGQRQTGSRFSFTLVLQTGEQAIANEEKTDWSRVAHLAQGHTVDALVVDDVADNRDILTQMLTRIGVNVETAENGELALQKINRHMPDIIFMDVRMPVMDGPEALKWIFKTHGRDTTKVLAVTASVFEHQRREYLELGFDGFLDKPLRTEQVYESLSQNLDVRYVFTEQQTASPVEEDWGAIRLPAELYNSLLDAVEEHSITNLKKHILELEGIGETMQPLATHLGKLTRNIDIDGIREVLEEIETLS
jgi:CheY-like chemotaxis protein